VKNVKTDHRNPGCAKHPEERPLAGLSMPVDPAINLHGQESLPSDDMRGYAGCGLFRSFTGRFRFSFEELHQLIFERRCRG